MSFRAIYKAGSLATIARHQCGIKHKYFACLQPVNKIHMGTQNYYPFQIDMPALSPTMEEGTIVSWVVEEGAEVATGDALCEVETDKAVVTMEAVEDGVLAKILMAAGTKNVKIGTPIAIMAEEGENVSEAAAMKVLHSTTSEPTSSTASLVDTQPMAATTNKVTPQNTRISPAVRQLLEQYEIDSSKVPASGPKNILLKGDVLSYVLKNNLQAKNFTSSSATPNTQSKKVTKEKPVQAQEKLKVSKSSSPSAFDDLEMTGMRKVIAKRLTESKQTIPHTYSSIDCTMNNVLKLRKELLQDDIKVSVNDFIVKAVAKALQDFPTINTVWKGEKAQPCKTVDVCVAVATDTGLITPIVKNADSKGLSKITSEIRELASRARKGKLRPNEFQGGSFTISNLGMFGIKEFTAVINPPQVCIMAIGGSRVVPTKQGEKLGSRNVMTVTLSSDARIVDVNEAENFLTQFKNNMENPLLMI